jgi:hypothetical protein
MCRRRTDREPAKEEAPLDLALGRQPFFSACRLVAGALVPSGKVMPGATPGF